MARHVRIPWLADLVIVDDAATIESLEQDTRIDRSFGDRGPWLNRLLQRRLTDRTAAADGPLPAFRPRADAARAEAQAALTQRLETIDGETLTGDPEIAELARWVRGAGKADAAAIGPVVQAFAGKLFGSDYTADAESFAAAQTIDRYLRSNPLTGAWLVVSGRLRQARAIIAARAGGNAHAEHATAIALHNIVAALLRMRQVWENPSLRSRATDGTIVGLCLTTPESALRTTSDRLQLASQRRPVMPGTLVIYRLATAFGGRADAAGTFRQGTWAQCPAHSLVPAMLRAVWRRAETEEAAP